jgi:hypothetical protein
MFEQPWPGRQQRIELGGWRLAGLLALAGVTLAVGTMESDRYEAPPFAQPPASGACVASERKAATPEPGPLEHPAAGGGSHDRCGAVSGSNKEPVRSDFYAVKPIAAPVPSPARSVSVARP